MNILSQIKIIDVTLRDGGYRNNFNFSQQFVSQILYNLELSRIDYIEIGYRNGSIIHYEDIGPSGLCHTEYLKLCRSHISKAKMTVMVHPKNVTEEDFIEMKECGVDAIRVVFPIKNPELGFQCLEYAFKHGFEVFVNLTRISNFSTEKILEIISTFSKYPIAALYFADSNGSLVPKHVEDIFNTVKEHCSFALGFHAHDNLSLAMANSIAALNCGATYIDSAILGFGKGIGNLRSELFTSVLSKFGCSKYNFAPLLDATQILNQYFPTVNTLNSKEIITGVLDLSVDEAAQVGEYSNAQSYYINAQNKFKNKNLNSQTSFTI